MDDELTVALELADLADGISMRHFRSRDLVVETKDNLTPVTVADREVEQAIRDRLASVRPADAVVGEEYGEGGAGDARWILDPIDGTKNFVRGIPIWGTLIALERRGDLVAAVASAPAMRRRWWAVRGGGAFADGEPIHVSGVDALEEALVCHGGLETWRRSARLRSFVDLALRCARSRGFGDFWMHMLVAEGSADVAAESDVTLWDLAAVKLIVEEAGGRFTDLDGTPTPEGGSAVSTNGILHDLVLTALAP